MFSKKLSKALATVEAERGGIEGSSSSSGGNSGGIGSGDGSGSGSGVQQEGAGVGAGVGAGGVSSPGHPDPGPREVSDVIKLWAFLHTADHFEDHAAVLSRLQEVRGGRE